MTDDTYVPDFDLGDFRYAVARYLKLLIRARWTVDPGFLTAAGLAGWGLSDVGRDLYPGWRLLEDAARQLSVLNERYLPPRQSGGVEVIYETTPVGRLVADVAFFVDGPGGGAFHCQALLDAAARLKAGQPVEWARLADWDQLGSIREQLDRLPHPPERQATQPAGSGGAEACDAANVFRRAGDGWIVRFEGGKDFVLGDAVGALYLHLLLGRPGVTFTVAEVASLAARHLAPGGDRRGVDAGAEGLVTDPSRDDGPVLDPDGRRASWEEFQSLGRDLEGARKDGDEAAASRIAAERQRLTEELGRAFTPSGRAKAVGGRQKKPVDRVTKAITREIEKIGKQDSRLSDHLTRFVATGSILGYHPKPLTSWET